MVNQVQVSIKIQCVEEGTNGRHNDGPTDEV
jgi:hypothetical protein